MEALDEMTLRKRRDRLLNPLTSPVAHLQMFQYVAPPVIPTPFQFGAIPPPPPPEMKNLDKKGSEKSVEKTCWDPNPPECVCFCSTLIDGVKSLNVK